IQPQNGQLFLEWQGGMPPYRLQQRNQLGGNEQWMEVPLADPSANTMLVPAKGAAGFYRISNAQ
ncbi:MAG: hypothetical protein NT154_26245, partial [Verrucomicrobia bacterium]|nr:hypothetical protein [Verrucomicrobiota bacterium]